MVNVTGGTEWHTSNRYVSLYIFIYLVLLVVVLTLSVRLESSPEAKKCITYFAVLTVPRRAFLLLVQKCLHDRPKLAALLPEAAMIILVGMAAGLLHFISDLDFNAHEEQMADEVVHSILAFSPTAFFVVLLPPVIFNGGYHIRRDLFFRYITPICLYACLGTSLCTMAVAGILYSIKGIFTFDISFLELLAFGAIVSATDPVSTLSVFSAKKVDPHLFYLVFGESVINDAVGLVLFEALAHLIETTNGNELAVSEEIFQFAFDFVTGFIGSLFLGALFGLLVAFFLKKVDMRSTPLLELCLYATIMYFPFVIAELFHLSGIVSVLFTAIAAKRYAEPNLSAMTAQNADTIFRLTAHLTETIIFLELGMSVFGLVGVGAFHPGFIGWSLIACLIGRAVNIYPITFIFNLCVSRGDKQAAVDDCVVEEMSAEEGQQDLVVKPIDDTKIPWSKANMLWFSGLRGAVSYALVRTFPDTGNKEIFIVTTIMIVLLTTFVFGGSTEWALGRLGVPVGVDEAEYLRSVRQRRLLVGWLHQFESTTLRGWVIRDFSIRKDENIDPNSDADEYHEHVELTEQDHFLNTRLNNNTASVYDFGQY